MEGWERIMSSTHTHTYIRSQPSTQTRTYEQRVIGVGWRGGGGGGNKCLASLDIVLQSNHAWGIGDSGWVGLAVACGLL